MNEPKHNKHTMNKKLLFLGLDVHAQNIAIANAEGGGGEARTYGTIPNDLHALEKVLAKLKKAHPGTELRVCYEAGPPASSWRGGSRNSRSPAPLSPRRSSPPGAASGSRPTGATP